MSQNVVGPQLLAPLPHRSQIRYRLDLTGAGRLTSLIMPMRNTENIPIPVEMQNKHHRRVDHDRVQAGRLGPGAVRPRRSHCEMTSE
jgi:hypothetical protein